MLGRMFDVNLTTKIDFGAVTCPLMFRSGADDLAIPPSTTARWIAAQYGDRSTFHEVAGLGHYLMLEHGWELLSDTCEAWVAENVAA